MSELGLGLYTTVPFFILFVFIGLAAYAARIMTKNKKPSDDENEK